MEVKVEYDTLLPREFEDRITDCPVVFVPVGWTPT